MSPAGIRNNLKWKNSSFFLEFPETEVCMKFKKHQLTAKSSDGNNDEVVIDVPRNYFLIHHQSTVLQMTPLSTLFVLLARVIGYLCRCCSEKPKEEKPLT